MTGSGGSGAIAASTDTFVESPITPRQLKLVLLGMALAILLASLDQTVVTTALPTIVGDLGGLNHLSWIVTAYLLATTIAVTVYGKLGDLYGRKRLFQIAIAIFIVGSLLCGIAQSMDQLIVFRTLAGLGGGGLTVSAQAIMGDLVAPSERGRYAGVMASAFAVTSVSGPLIGGVFTEHLSWRWIFYINLPLGAIAVTVISIVVPTSRHRRDHRLDYTGMAVLTAFSVCLVLALTWGGAQYAWTSTQVLSLIGITLVLVPVFLAVEHRAVEPVIPLRLFRNSVFTVSVAATGIVGMVMVGEVTFFPTFLQLIHGSSPTISGLQTAPSAIALLLTSIWTGRRVSRLGTYRIYPLVGSAILILGTAQIALLGTGEHSPYWRLAVGMALFGVGLSMTTTVYTLTTQNSVPQRHIGIAIALMSFFRSIGGAVGVAIFGGIFTSRLAAALGSARGQVGGDPAHLTPAQLHALRARSPAVYRHLIDAFDHALHLVFLSGIVVGVAALLISLLLKEEPLSHAITHDTAAAPDLAAPRPMST